MKFPLILKAFFCCIFFSLLIVKPAHAIEQFKNSIYHNKQFLSAQVTKLYSDKNSKIDNEANDIAQTPDGVVWIAAYAGLFRFDSNKFSLITEKDYPVFKSSSSRALYVDTEGTLWIGTNDRGLFSLKDGVMRHYKPQGELTNSIRGIFNGGDHIYAMTTSGLGRVNGDSIERVLLSVDNDYFVSGVVDKEQRLFLVNKKGELLSSSLDGSHFKKIDIGEHKARTIRLSAHSDLKDRLYVVSNGGWILILNTDTGLIEDKIKLKGMVGANYSFVDRDGQIWIGGSNGVGFIDTDKVFHKIVLDKRYAQFQGIMQDYEGNLWIAAYLGGVFKFSPSKFIDIFFDNSMEKTMVNANILYRDKLYVGTDFGLKIIGQDGEEENQLTQMLRSVRVRNFYVDTQNNLWICTYQQGVYRITNGEVSGHWDTHNGLPSVKSRTLVQANDGTIYVGTVAGVAAIKDDRVVRTYTAKDGIKTDYTLTLEAVADKLYIGTDGSGLYALDLRTQVLTNVSEKLDVSVVLRSKVDPQSGVIFLTSGTLHMIYPDGRVRTISQHVFEGDIYDIHIYGESLVLVSSKGIYIANLEQVIANEAFTFSELGSTSGLFNIPMANAWNYLSDKGKFYISTRGGVLYLDLENIIQQDMVPPKIGIDKILVDSKPINYREEIRLDSDVQKIDIIPSVFSFNGSEKNTIKFRLQGFDKENRHVKLAENLSISYTNLDGGDYTFVFTGINSDGIESVAPISIKIHKDYSIFERKETYFVLTLFLIMVTYFLSRLWMSKKEERLIVERNKYREITSGAIQVIARTIDAKDDYTHGHSQRVADYSVLIAEQLGFDEKELEELYYTSLLHDIGKISIPDRILNKPGRLLPNELEVMQSHAIRGYEILQDFKQADYLCLGALYHHERFDGKGYPHQMKGEEIPLLGRILTVADSYDAMATDRPYRKGLSRDLVIQEFEKGRGKQFDPQILDIMIQLLDTDELKLIALKTPSHL